MGACTTEWFSPDEKMTARAASSVCAHDASFDVALSWFTNRFSTSAMTLKDQRYIQSGSSGYSFRSLLSHARELLISSQIKFMYLGALLGAATADSKPTGVDISSGEATALPRIRAGAGMGITDAGYADYWRLYNSDDRYSSGIPYGSCTTGTWKACFFHR